MKVSEAIALLEAAPDPDSHLETAGLSGDFWRGIACTALKAARGAIKLDGEQSAVFDVILAQLCGG